MKIASRNPFDEKFRRLRYIRYADDFMLGLDGPKAEAEAIRDRLRDFLRDHLKLELSQEKTLITHAKTDKARFLGYEVSIWNARGFAHGIPILRIPNQAIEEKIKRYRQKGKPVARLELIDESDLAIIDRYGQEFRGYAQYYAYARNRFWLNRLQWYMHVSLLKTLAGKHKSSVQKMATRFAGLALSDNGVLKCLSVKVERKDKRPLYAQFGGISLKRQEFAVIEDIPVDQDRRIERNELIQRLNADECELCGSRDRVQSHHIRKLADLKRKGQGLPAIWRQVMSARQRKTLIVCHYCHTAIHAGRPTRTRDSHDVNDGRQPLESRVL